jgi:hypothetical protein
VNTLAPLPAAYGRAPDLAVWIRAADASGRPTDDRYSVPMLLGVR